MATAASGAAGAVSMAKVGLEVTGGIFLVPVLTLWLPSPIFQIAVERILPVLLKRVFFQTMSKTVCLLQSQQLTLGKLISIFVASQFCAFRHITRVPTNLEAHIPSWCTMGL
jgi:hypothetical protein